MFHVLDQLVILSRSTESEEVGPKTHCETEVKKLGREWAMITSVHRTIFCFHDILSSLKCNSISFFFKSFLISETFLGTILIVLGLLCLADRNAWRYGHLPRCCLA